jgi:hypothetical protein
MYTYVKSNDPDSAHPFPITRIHDRPAIRPEEGLKWWAAKEARVQAKAATT